MNRNFTAFDPATGRVLFGGSSYNPKSMETDQISILLDQDYRDGWLDNGMHHELPARPSLHHEFNYTTRQWEDPRTLADLKSARNAYINTSRLAANQSHFTHLGKQIAADPLSRSDIDAINGEVTNTGAFPAGWPGAWKCMDNTWMTISTIDQWKALYTSMVNQGTTNFGHAQALKGQLEAATTAAEVEAVVWHE